MLPKFATYDDLRHFSKSLTIDRSAILLKAVKSMSLKDTFLSHSSKDAEYLPVVIDLLRQHGASVYCALDDNRMPKDPNPETADLIRDQIAKSDRLVVFVTKNTKDSKWIPWELGIGDVKLGLSNVALFPSAEDTYDQVWAQQEYLGIYRHIVWGNLQDHNGLLWMVYDYRKNEAIPLEDWCRPKIRLR